MKNLRAKISQSRFVVEFSHTISFIIFSFLNTFLPIALCIIASFIKGYGAHATMAIGYVAPFTLGFMQLSISFGIWTFNSLIKRTQFTKNREISRTEFDKIFSSSIFLSITMGAILCAFYVLFAFFYMYFSSNRPNTIPTLYYGYDYIATTIPYVLLMCLKSNLVLYIYYYFKKTATIFEIFFNVLSLLFAIVLGVVFNWQVKGIGAALSISMIVYVLLLSLFISKKCSFHFYRVSIYRFQDSFKQMKRILSESIGGLSMALFKGVALLALGLSIPAQMGSRVPLSFQMARVIWFNYMSFLPFIAVGIANSIEYYDLFKPLDTIKFGTYYRKKYSIWLSVAVLFTLPLAIGFMYLVRPLTELYIAQNDFTPDSFPQLPGVTITLENLPPNQLPPMEQIIPPASVTDPAKELYTKLQTIDRNNDGWISPLELIKFRKENKVLIDQLIAGLNEWGNTLQNTIQTDEVTKKWIDWLVDPKSRDILLYAIDNPESFKNWMVDYIKYTSMDLDVIVALVNYDVGFNPNNFLVQKLDFKAKTMIYIIIYSCMNCWYTILLPASRKLQGRKVHAAIVCLVYGLCIGGVVTFGIIFSIYFDIWAPNLYNPFKYMDGWTFATLLAATIVAFYLWVKWFILVSKDKKKSNKKNSDFI